MGPDRTGRTGQSVAVMVRSDLGLARSDHIIALSAGISYRAEAEMELDGSVAAKATRFFDVLWRARSSQGL